MTATGRPPGIWPPPEVSQTGFGSAEAQLFIWRPKGGVASRRRGASKVEVVTPVIMAVDGREINT